MEHHRVRRGTSSEQILPQTGKYMAVDINNHQGVFTALIEQLGVQDVQFEEIISLDAESIRALR